MEKKNDIKSLLLIIFTIIAVVLGGFIIYDKILNEKEEKKCQCEKCEVCEKCDDNKTQCNCTNENVCLGERISSIKKIKLTNENQVIKVGNKKYKMKICSENNDYGEQLSIDDSCINISAYNVYLTDKFVFTTVGGQIKESIEYALSENGEVVVNNNNSQMDNFRLVNGYLHADGGEVYYDQDLGIKEEDLIIKFIDNTLIVVPAK